MGWEVTWLVLVTWTVTGKAEMQTSILLIWSPRFWRPLCDSLGPRGASRQQEFWANGSQPGSFIWVIVNWSHCSNRMVYSQRITKQESTAASDLWDAWNHAREGNQLAEICILMNLISNAGGKHQPFRQGGSQTRVSESPVGFVIVPSGCYNGHSRCLGWTQEFTFIINSQVVLMLPLA